MFKYLWMIFLLFSFAISCRSTGDAQLQSAVLDHDNSTLVVSPFWDLHAGYLTGYHDSLLRVCQPETQEMVQYLKLKAEVDAQRNAKLMHLCHYNNRIVELLYRLEGKQEPIYPSQTIEGVCFQKIYQGELEDRLNTGLSKVKLFSLSYLTDIFGQSSLKDLVLNASDVFSFIENEEERNYAVDSTKKLGANLDRIAQNYSQSSQAFNTFVESLIAEGKTKLHCNEVALIDGSTVLRNLDQKSKSELKKKAIIMIQGRDLLNRPGVGLEGQRVAFSDPPIHEFTYVLDEIDEVKNSIVQSITPIARKVVQSEEFKEADDKVKRVDVLEKISQALYSTVMTLNPKWMDAQNPQELHKLLSTHEIDKDYEQSEFDAISKIIQNKLQNNSWNFNDTDFGSYPTEQIAGIWNFYVSCKASPDGCVHPPYLAPHVNPTDVASIMQSLISQRQLENQKIFESAANKLRSKLLGNE